MKDSVARFFAEGGKRTKGYAPILGKVTNSVEFQRILALPRRRLDLSKVDDVTPLFAKSGELSFWPIQSAALIEAAKANGLFAAVGVGYGKTLIGLALPEALESKKTVYLVKPDLKKQLEREIQTFYGKHFRLPLDRIVIVSYSELSSAKDADVLEREMPDLIVADEAHCLKRKQSARTKRFLRYMKRNPWCRLAALSGTMTTRSILDYAHLIELVLRKNSPLPSGYYELRDWAGSLDVDPEYRTEPGVLLQFCEGEDVREGFRRRLVETEGVVTTEEGSIGTSLVIKKQSPSVPQNVKELIAQVRKRWSIEDEELEDASARARVLKQIACGFYYRWDWGDGPDLEWLEARAAWHREVRQKLTHASEGFDSPLLLARAAERFYDWDMSGREGKRPELAWDSAAWPAWREVKDRKPPPTVPVWKSDFLVDAALKWAFKQKQPSIIWYEWNALGERIAAKGGLPIYGAGTDAGERNHKIIVASIRAQGTGKNLQHYCHNLFTTVPPNGTAVEQAMGRTHRPGQKSDEVTVDWFGHTPELEEAMARAIEDAEYMEGTTGQRQKILYATRVW